MTNAARESDACAHGGMITSGSPDTLICERPAAREADQHMCPIPGHGPGKLMSTSTTVFINSHGAARKTDEIACAAPTAPPPGGTWHKAAEYREDENGSLKALFVEAESTEEKTSVAGGFLEWKVAGDGWEAETEALTGEAYVTNSGAGVEGTLWSGSATGHLGPASGTVGGKLLSGTASYDGWAGVNGCKIGLGGGGALDGSVAGVSATGGIDTGHWQVPFTDWTFAAKASGTGELGVGAGGEGSGALYYDQCDGRTYLKSTASANLLAKLGWDVEISIGRAPDLPTEGAPNVYIGSEEAEAFASEMKEAQDAALANDLDWAPKMQEVLATKAENPALFEAAHQYLQKGSW